MKKVNFEKLELRSLSGETEEADVRKVAGEVIYARMPGLRMKLLAEKVYKSEGETGLTEDEEGALREAAELFPGKLRDALLGALDV